ncbi:putative pentatricopeptide repeat-containing protein-like [Capsicum annuum]|uniref:sister chromatid cohesion protein PDS5 homolog C isoform X2 n=1 Tax=Capsicum annuum TaxID=4072 RepID=UPI0007BF3D06|nr:sister chromatid cohesion protein PDS5 homolog C isoform X2 [Capsicum annuum]KAF3622890.1 putative pentatricopeptide repeat-containing protein-like [Capsicum annuum]
MADSPSSSSSQKEIEEGLKECGISLNNLPSSTEELITLLDKVESVLLKVGQAPTDSIKDALQPVMKAMVGDELLKHSDVDVTVSVVSCINELAIISAPLQPYDDVLMKEIFQLTIRAFEELSNSGRSYHKAVNVLRSVAEVKASVLLLDLECDALVMEMFEMFPRIIRPDHPNVVFTSMEVIMTQLIEESDEIKMELLQPLLDSLRKENQIWSPISSKLGEKVLKECASTVRPCLLEALKSGTMNLDDYVDIVASICRTPGGEEMMENKNATDAVSPIKVGPSASVISETLPEDGAPLNNDGTFLKTLQHCSHDEHKGTSGSKRKSCQRSRKSRSVLKGAVDTTSGLNIVKREGNFTDAEESSVKQIDEKKQKNDRATIEIHDIEESGDEKIKLAFGDENPSSELAKPKRRRKLSVKKDEDSKRRRFTKKYGEEIVGTRIRVWWPLDRMFYEGAVSTFDPVNKKHQITYDDGETEILNLSKERFEILEDNPSDKEHEADLQCNAVSSVPSTKKKAKRNSSIKKKPGISSSKRSKKNPQKSDIECMDIPIPDKMNDAADVGCETSSGKKERVDKEDNDIRQKQGSEAYKVLLERSLLEDHPSDKNRETDLQSNDVSAVVSTEKAKIIFSIKKKPGVSSSKRSKRNPQKSDIVSMDIPIPDKTNAAADIGYETSSGKKDSVDKKDNDISQKRRSRTPKIAVENSLTLEDHLSDKYVQKHETDLQSNVVSSVPSMKKKAKRTTSIKKEPGISTSKRFKRKPQKSDIESLDIPIPYPMNDAADVGCKTSSGDKEHVDKEDNDITQKQRSKTCKAALDCSLALEDQPSDKKPEADLQSNDVSSSLSTKRKAKRTSSIKKESVSSSKRSKRKAQKSGIESLDVLIPDEVNDASDVGCKMIVSSSKRSKRKAQKSDIESLDVLIPDEMNDASAVGCETSYGDKERLDKEDNMITEAESKTLEVVP